MDGSIGANRWRGMYIAPGCEPARSDPRRFAPSLSRSSVGLSLDAQAAGWPRGSGCTTIREAARKLNLPADVIVELGDSAAHPAAPQLLTPTR